MIVWSELKPGDMLVSDRVEYPNCSLLVLGVAPNTARKWSEGCLIKITMIYLWGYEGITSVYTGAGDSDNHWSLLARSEK